MITIHIEINVRGYYLEYADKVRLAKLKDKDGNLIHKSADDEEYWNPTPFTSHKTTTKY